VLVELTRKELLAAVNALTARADFFRTKLQETNGESHEVVRLLRRYMTEDETLAARLFEQLKPPR
jgi:hypothetical protein